MRAYLKRLYPYVPAVFQNAAISAFGLVYKHERFGGEFRDVLAEFEARDRWEIGRMREYLDRELRRVVKRAIDAPYYRERWRAAGVRDRDLDELTVDSLHRLPILPKSEVRRAPRAFVPDRSPQVRGILTYYSSGSTGTPLEALCTRAGQRRFAAAREARSYRCVAGAASCSFPGMVKASGATRRAPPCAWCVPRRMERRPWSQPRTASGVWPACWVKWWSPRRYARPVGSATCANVNQRSHWRALCSAFPLLPCVKEACGLPSMSMAARAAGRRRG